MSAKSIRRSGILNFGGFRNLQASSTVAPQLWYLAVAGGGSNGNSRAGGGAGGYLTNWASDLSGGNGVAPYVGLATGINYSVTVGAGAAVATTLPGNRGSNTTFGNNSQGWVFTIGGGSANHYFQQTEGAHAANNVGGCGGGVGTAGFSSPPAIQMPGSLPTQGFPCKAHGSQSEVGPGGGAGSTGEGRNGGQGLASTITGTSVRRGGGGAGGQQGNGAAQGTAYDGGGISGSGAANTGGGAGGAQNTGNGGSGILILRYPSRYNIIIGAGLTASTAAVGPDKVTTITAGTGNVSWE
jgi:hypothetical protein